MGRVRESDLAAFGHQEVPFERVVEVVAPPRSATRHPLFQTVLTFDSAGSEAVEAIGHMPGLTVEPQDVDLGTVKFDLTFVVVEHSDDGEPAGCSGTVEYCADMFDRATVEGLAERLGSVLEQAMSEPDRPISAIDLVTPAERAAILGSWQNTGRGVVTGSVPGLLADLAAERPAAPAVAAGDRELDRAELDRRATALAHRLRAQGVRPEDRVGVLMQRSLALVVSLLAVTKAGAAYVPLGAQYPDERLSWMLDTVGAPLLLTDAPLAERAGRLDALSMMVVDPEGRAHTDPGCSPDSTAPLPEVRPRQVAYVMFTSGSTGDPKGVAIEHRDIAVLAADRIWDGVTDRVPLHSPHAWDASILELWVPLLRGGSVLVAPPGDLDAEALRSMIADEGCTSLFLTAGLFRVMTHEYPECFAAVRQVATGGDVVPPSAVRAVHRHAPGTRVVNAYGPTEATVVALSYDADSDSDHDWSGGLPIGRCSDNMQHRVLDERLRLLPPGSTGELYVGGAGVARGYWGRPKLTAERFVPDPYGPPGARLYRTGDLVRWKHDGRTEFVGRADDQVKIRGFRVEPGEIEAAISAVPGVESCAVVVREDRPGDKRLAAYVVPTDGFGADELRPRLSRALPDYMVPATITSLDELPLTAIGKLDRDRLPAPQVSSGSRGREPRTPTETVLARLFAEVLNSPDATVDDGFFELGGDSILAIQLVSRARRAGVAITAADVFTYRTVVDLAAVAKTDPDAVEDAEPDVGTGDLAATPMTRWIAERGVPLERFNQTTLLWSPPRLDFDALVAVVTALTERHDSLRMRLLPGDPEGEPTATVDEHGTVPVAVQRVDARAADGSELDRLVAAAGDAAVDRLDPFAGRMLDVVWLDRGTQPGVVVLAGHHLAVDGVSWRILLPDLVEVWDAISAGEVPQPPPVGTSWRRWTHALADAAGDAVRRAEIEHWERTLDGGQAVIASRAVNPKSDTRAVATSMTRTLPVDLTRAVLADVPAAVNGGVDDALLAALVLAVAGIGGGETGPLTVDLESHGRTDDLLPGADLSATTGWFTSLHPVRLDLGGADPADAFDGGESAGVVLKRVKEQLRAVPGGGLGFGLLRYLDDEGRLRLAGLPVPQIGFNYLGRFVDGETGEWSVATELPKPHGEHRDTPQAHPLEVNAATVEGPGGPQLTVTWTWAPGAVDDELAAGIADGWTAALQGLAGYAADPGAGGLTPHDVRLIGITQTEIEEFELTSESDWEW